MSRHSEKRTHCVSSMRQVCRYVDKRSCAHSTGSCNAGRQVNVALSLPLTVKVRAQLRSSLSEEGVVLPYLLRHNFVRFDDVDFVRILQLVVKSNTLAIHLWVGHTQAHLCVNLEGSVEHSAAATQVQDRSILQEDVAALAENLHLDVLHELLRIFAALMQALQPRGGFFGTVSRHVATLCNLVHFLRANLYLKRDIATRVQPDPM
mmetsp:Transcript_33696/g.76953  ORF Transcript_33696/g.76953 Transcript_33696/m.76953 type:complete len:206 (+) Transcript_33696:58-675(+)